jgi:hypothetical protein
MVLAPTNRHGRRLRKRYGKVRSDLFTFLEDRVPCRGVTTRDVIAVSGGLAGAVRLPRRAG